MWCVFGGGFKFCLMGHKNCVYCSQGHIMNKYEEMVVETVVIVILTPTPPLVPGCI